MPDHPPDPQRENRRVRRAVVIAIVGFFAMVGLLIAVGVILPIWSKARQKQSRIDAAQNLKVIGEALLLYSGDDFRNPHLIPLSDTDAVSAELRIYTAPRVSDTEALRAIYAPPSHARFDSDPTGTYTYSGKPADSPAAAPAPATTPPAPGGWSDALFIDVHPETPAATK